ncbi:ATP-binding protein [Streptomyces sp. NPDC017979]|uniref:ATP-binding protein n=1 Tax=Streptomyces sp. NPDC017979 TaxID=3365024 RepID=UPI0037ABE399
MKQSAVKTLGVTALGAAFAAAAAGTAAAAPAALPAAPSLDTVTSVVPVQDTLTQLPAGAPDSLSGAQNALTESASTLPGTLQGAGERVLGGKGASGDPVSGLLGGLPVGGLTGGGLT